MIIQRDTSHDESTKVLSQGQDASQGYCCQGEGHVNVQPFCLHSQILWQDTCYKHNANLHCRTSAAAAAADDVAMVTLPVVSL